MIDYIKLAEEANKYFFNTEYYKALSLYYQILAADLTNSINYYNIGITYEMLNEYELSVSYYKKSIRINNYIRSIDNLARIYIDIIKDNNIAKEYLDFAIKTAPDDAEAYNLYSRICILDKDYKLAESYLKKSIFLDENYFKNYYDLANLYYLTGDKTNAKIMINKCISLQKDFAPAQELLKSITALNSI